MNEIMINSEEQFNEVIKDGVVLVDFFASWCGPCKMLAPIVKEVAEDYGDKIKVCKVDVDNVEVLAYKYNIRSIPALLYFKDGKLKEIEVGFKDKKAISACLDKYIN